MRIWHTFQRYIKCNLIVPWELEQNLPAKATKLRTWLLSWLCVKNKKATLSLSIHSASLNYFFPRSFYFIISSWRSDYEIRNTLLGLKNWEKKGEKVSHCHFISPKFIYNLPFFFFILLFPLLSADQPYYSKQLYIPVQTINTSQC